jgi:hypothetical protein
MRTIPGANNLAFDTHVGNRMIGGYDETTPVGLTPLGVPVKMLDLGSGGGSAVPGAPRMLQRLCSNASGCKPERIFSYRAASQRLRGC